MATLHEPLGRTPLGPKAAKAFDDAFGLRTVSDLLRHYPRRYHQRGELTDLASLRDRRARDGLRPGGEASSRARWGTARARSLEVVVTDGADKLALTFFNKAGVLAAAAGPRARSACSPARCPPSGAGASSRTRTAS